MGWQDLGAAFALFLVIEGLLPFASPSSLRTAMRAMGELTDQQLRTAGFVSMVLGLLLLYLVK